MSATREYRTIQNIFQTVRTAQKGITFSCQALQATVGTLSSTAQAVYHTVNQTLDTASPTVIQSVSATRQTAQTLQQQALQLAQQSHLSIPEAAQVAALVAANAYVTAEPQTLQNAWKPLQNANSIESAKTALTSFMEQLETSHQGVVVEQLVVACTRAALKVGFEPVQSTTTIVNGTVRLIASDQTGRSLVTEIATNPDAAIPMATEIIGSSDSSCETILDAFEAALAEEGVTTAPPQRKFTGGMYELEASRDFIRQRPTRQSSQTTNKPRSQKVARSAPPQQQMKQG